MPERNGPASQVRLLGRLLAGEELAVDPDWAALLRLASRYKLSPLLYWRLQEREAATGEAGQDHDGGPAGGWSALPGPVRDALRQDYFAAAAHSLLAEQQLVQVLEALDRAGVPVVVLKGAAFAALYPEPALRTYKDLDLLVAEADLDRVEAALHGLDYRYLKAKEWALAQHRHLPPLVGSPFQLEVEVHWRLDKSTEPASLPVDELWNRVEPWSVAGQGALRLEAVDAALHLCQHAVIQHRGRMGLGPLCDLAQMVAAWQPADWQSLAGRAIRYRLGSAVYLMLTLAQQLLGTAAPPAVLEALRPAGIEPLPQDLLERLLPPEQVPEAHVPMALLRAESQGSFLAGARHFLKRLFPSRDEMAAMYGVPAGSLRIGFIYLWRPVDLLRQYGLAAWGMVWGHRSARAAWQREAWIERWLAETSRAASPDHD